MNIEVCKLDGGKLLVNTKYLEVLRFNGLDTADSICGMESEPVKRKLKERGTERAFLKSPGQPEDLEVYIKRYSAIPIKDYLKSALNLKPVFSDGAFHEWDAILAFHLRGLNTMEPIAAARCREGTCLVTKGIRNYRRASELFPAFSAGDLQGKRRLIADIADLAGRMHSANFAHQDFYLVHMFVTPDEDCKLYI